MFQLWRTALGSFFNRTVNMDIPAVTHVRSSPCLSSSSCRVYHRNRGQHEASTPDTAALLRDAVIEDVGQNEERSICLLTKENIRVDPIRAAGRKPATVNERAVMWSWIAHAWESLEPWTS